MRADLERFAIAEPARGRRDLPVPTAPPRPERSGPGGPSYKGYPVVSLATANRLNDGGAARRRSWTGAWPRASRNPSSRSKPVPWWCGFGPGDPARVTAVAVGAIQKHGISHR